MLQSWGLKDHSAAPPGGQWFFTLSREVGHRGGEGWGGGGGKGAGPPALKAHEGQIHTCKNGFNSELRPPPRFTQIPSEKFFRSATKRMQWYKSVIPYKYSIYTCLYCSLCILIHRGIFCQEAAGGEGGQRWPVKRRWSLKTQVRVPFYPRSTLSCSINRRHLELMYRKRTEKEKDLSQSSQTERMTGLAPLRFWPHLDRPTGPRPSGRAAGCKRFLKKGCEYCDRFLCMCHVGQNEESS